MEDQKKIRTAYGEHDTTPIDHFTKQALVANVSEALSIRGKDPVVFANKLRELLLDFGPNTVKPGKELNEKELRGITNRRH